MESFLRIFMKRESLRKSQEMSRWTHEDNYDPDASVTDPDDVTFRHVAVHQSDIKGTYVHWIDRLYYDLCKSDVNFSPDDDSVFYDPYYYGDDDAYTYIGDDDIDDFNIVNENED